MEDGRVSGLASWAREVLPGLGANVSSSAELVPVSDDASFRRYFRFTEGADRFVLVDAPPEQEDNESFIKISKALVRSGLNSPEVFAADVTQGYLVITDLGDVLYLQAVREDPSRLRPLYNEAIDSLIVMMGVECDVPNYDESRLREEMSLFPDWFLGQKLGLEMTAGQREMLSAVETLMVENAIEQPQVFVHRDYHCRNLMVTAGKPGIIDFQDAVTGPITYDLVSLFKDCYYRFARDEVVDWVAKFRERLVKEGRLDGVTEAEFLKWFDLMGVQRHLKCAGIFSRLHLRDGKARYLSDIPLVISYLMEASSAYPELHDLHGFLHTHIEPRMTEASFSGTGLS